MKKIYSLLLLSFVLVLTGTAQIVTTTPEFPAEDAAVTLVFDATKGTGKLKGFKGDVYAHTGVITDKSASSSDWKYDPKWGDNAAKYKLKSLGGDKWQLDITPDIRTYYGVAAGETIKQMAFVFRSADCSLQGKETGDKDIFVSVYAQDLAIRFDQPTDGQVLGEGESLSIKATASQAATLSLYVGNDRVATKAGATEITATHTFTQAGLYTVRAEAQSGSNTVSTTRQVNVQKATAHEPLPAGVRPGINYHADQTRATLVLQAPGKKNAFAVGDFNNWQPLPEYQLKQDGEYFWITLTDLTPKQEYAFRYVVDGTIAVADPYTEKVLDSWNDAAIPTSVYPNLKAFPQAAGEGIVSVLQTGQTPYAWQVTDFEAPHKEQLIIYEMLIRDFTTAHSYKAAIQRLDYLKTLGVNAIELMPVNEFDGNSSWGYNPAFYFAPDKYYGTKDDLKLFIDECHARGMAVILDLVLNHSYGQSPFYLLYRDADGAPAANNPWYNVQSNITNTSLQWGYDFNHESTYTKALVDSVASFWMHEYKVDGFRYDFTKGFSNTTPPDEWASSYDAARIAILKRMAAEVWKRNDRAYVIFEHLTDQREEKELGQEGIMLWRNMNHAYCQTAMGYAAESGFAGLYAGTSMPAASLVGYMESHDEERTAFKALTYGDGNLKTYIAERMKLAKTNAAFFLTVPGPKMIWQFGELAYDISIEQNGRTGEKPVKWDYAVVSQRKALYETYSKLIGLRAAHPELFASDAQFAWKVSVSDWNTGRFITSVAGDKAMVVAGNFTDVAGQYTIDFPKTGIWHDFISGTTLEVTTAATSVSVPAREFRLFLNFDPTVGIDSLPAGTAGGIFYNPSADELQLSGQPAARVEIYSTTGTLVLRCEHASTVGLSILPSGCYIAKALLSNGKVETCKFVR